MNTRQTDQAIVAILNLPRRRFWAVALIGGLAAAGYFINAVKWWQAKAV